MQYYLLCKEENSDLLQDMIDSFLGLGKFKKITDLDQVSDERPISIVFALELDWLGENRFVSDQLSNWLSKTNLDGVFGGLLLFSEHFWFTKRFSQRLIFVLNQRGMAFQGHSVFEVLPGYENFRTWQQNLGLPLEVVCRQRLETFHDSFLITEKVTAKKIVVLHASHHPISNTFQLWKLAEQHLLDFDIEVLGIENGTIVDCKGCAFQTCSHYADNRSCFYGGQMTNEILPAIERADIVVWICPNYNDAISAMHAALINRLTVLYRRISFRTKHMYGVIVSANSGCDSVACQLIGALNINKGFALPPKGFLTAIASAPGTLNQDPSIEQRALEFANQIIKNCNSSK